MSVDLEACLKAAVCAARGAGDMLRSFWEKDSQKKDSAFIEFKSQTDLVTVADKQAEDLIIRTLRDACPLFGFLCEESGASNDSSASQARWIVDPLDGTTSFAHGHPHFSVSIALEVGAEIVLGVVYGVVLDEMFVARKGKGSTLNNKSIHTSKTKELINALIVTGFPTDRAQ
jgi:myo-inositol-1(or 4)-monophosphatase